MRPKFWMLLLVIVTTYSLVYANEDKYPRLTINGWGWLSFGQIMESAYIKDDPLSNSTDNYYAPSYQYYDFSHAWLMDVDAGVRFSAQVTEMTRICLHPGIGVRYNSALKDDDKMGGVKEFREDFRPYLIELSLTSDLVKSEKIGFQIKAGYFSVKYNPQVRNLGEYLLRSTAYPPLLVSGFELADKHKILGIKAKLSLSDVLDQEILFHSETHRYPLFDFSLGYIAAFHPHPVIEIGAGVEFSRLISVDEKKTTPGYDTEAIKGSSDRYFSMYIDGVDTTLYTFRAIKAMGRLTFDPKGFFSSSILGKEDLKIYTEAALLGAKNYPGFYEERDERVPVMFGFNFPTFKILDILSLEFEWFGSKYANSYRYIWEHRSPIPNSGIAVGSVGDADDNFYPFKDQDNWKWSVYASKKIKKHLRISGQVARDHKQRTEHMTGYFKVYEEICQQKKDWYWMVRTTFMF